MAISWSNLIGFCWKMTFFWYSCSSSLTNLSEPHFARTWRLGTYGRPVQLTEMFILHPLFHEVHWSSAFFFFFKETTLCICFDALEMSWYWLKVGNIAKFLNWSTFTLDPTNIKDTGKLNRYGRCTASMKNCTNVIWNITFICVDINYVFIQLIFSNADWCNAYQFIHIRCNKLINRWIVKAV